MVSWRVSYNRGDVKKVVVTGVAHHKVEAPPPLYEEVVRGDEEDVVELVERGCDGKGRISK